MFNFDAMQQMVNDHRNQLMAEAAIARGRHTAPARSAAHGRSQRRLPWRAASLVAAGVTSRRDLAASAATKGP